MAWVPPCRSEHTAITAKPGRRQWRAALTISGAAWPTNKVSLTLAPVFCFLAQYQLALQLQPMSHGPHKRHVDKVEASCLCLALNIQQLAT